jgi:16S rRNA (cytosine1407-C5)-methyltransferase
VSVSLASLPGDLKDAKEFAARLIEAFGERRAENIVAQLNADGDLVYWVNPLQAGDFTPVGVRLNGQPRLWQIPRDSGFTTSDAATQGLVYIQNPSSFFAVQVLDPQPDEEILDLAAAPGGKTIAIAAAMGNTGRLAAVEPVKGRFHRLRANVERCGVTNVDFYQRDGRGVGRAVPERFDRVLLDAPCSSEARMRWANPGSYAHWSLRKIKETQRKQKSLLRSGYAALKPGGYLVYCTCSFAPEENELVVQHLLRRTDATLETIRHELDAEHTLGGLTTWRGKTLLPELSRALRIMPHGVWDGFFIALLRKPA